MGPTVPWRQPVRWQTTRLTSAESKPPSPCGFANSHSVPPCRDSGAILGASQIYETLLRTGKAKKTCTACNRHLNTQEMLVFENFVSIFYLSPTRLSIDRLRLAQLQEQMKRTSPDRIKQEQEELKEWQMELADVQRLLSVEAAKNKLVGREIPDLEQSIKESQKEIPLLTDVVNNVRRVGTDPHSEC